MIEWLSLNHDNVLVRPSLRNLALLDDVNPVGHAHRRDYSGVRFGLRRIRVLYTVAVKSVSVYLSRESP